MAAAALPRTRLEVIDAGDPPKVQTAAPSAWPPAPRAPIRFAVSLVFEIVSLPLTYAPPPVASGNADADDAVAWFREMVEPRIVASAPEDSPAPYAVAVPPNAEARLPAMYEAVTVRFPTDSSPPGPTVLEGAAASLSVIVTLFSEVGPG